MADVEDVGGHGKDGRGPGHDACLLVTGGMETLHFWSVVYRALPHTEVFRKPAYDRVETQALPVGYEFGNAKVVGVLTGDSEAFWLVKA